MPVPCSKEPTNNQVLGTVLLKSALHTWYGASVECLMQLNQPLLLLLPLLRYHGIIHDVHAVHASGARRPSEQVTFPNGWRQAASRLAAVRV